MFEDMFTASDDDRAIIKEIASRASALYGQMDIERDVMDIIMDLEATHCNGCPLRLRDMLAANCYDLMHDIRGIANHLDRTTGKLTGWFLPRFSAPEGGAE